MIELLVRHLLVLGFAWLLSLGLRKRSAALRHALWTAALALCALLPLLQFVPLTLPANPAVPPAFDWAAAQPGAPQPAAGASVHGTPQVSAQFPWALIGVALYVAVALSKALRWRLGLQQARRLARNGQLSHLERGIPVIIADGVGPLNFGWPRSAIIVPTTDLARNELVLRHELAHVQRGDFLWQTIGALACALWWFSPAAWLAQRQLRREAELACDDCVLNAGTPAPDYAQTLLDVAALKSGSVPIPEPLVPLITGTDLERRITATLAPLRERGGVRPLSLGALVLVLLPFALSVSQPELASSAERASILAGKRIALDPGHGGVDPGATVDGIREADVVLAISQRAKALLEQAGAQVTMTREGDDFLDLRTRAAASANKDLFLSVHVEGSGRTSTLVHYFDGNDRSAAADAREFARVYAGFSGAAGGLVPATGKTGRAAFSVLKNAKSSALLVNVALLDPAQDRAALLDPATIEALALGLVNGAEAVLQQRVRTLP